MPRVVEDLKWARQLPGWPHGIPKPNKRQIGIKFERRVARALPPGAQAGVWWEFCDRNGPGMCQTDFIIPGRSHVLILESKNTWTDGAWEQLYELYRPVVGKALGLTPLCVQICHNLLPWTEGIVVTTLEDAIKEASRARGVTLHWRGLGPLWGLARRSIAEPALASV